MCIYYLATFIQFIYLKKNHVQTIFLRKNFASNDVTVRSNNSLINNSVSLRPFIAYRSPNSRRVCYLSLSQLRWNEKTMSHSRRAAVSWLWRTEQIVAQLIVKSRDRLEAQPWRATLLSINETATCPPLFYSPLPLNWSVWVPEVMLCWPNWIFCDTVAVSAESRL